MSDKVWRPHPRQEEFLSIPYSIFERFYGGAAGGGKSELLVLIPIIKGLYKNPRFKGLLLRRTYPELERSLIARSREWYPFTGAKWNDRLHRWTWPSGAFVDFGHIEYEKDVRTYDTTEYNYVGLDELTSFTEFQYRYISSRCRTSVADLPAFVCSASNPGNIGHGWVRKRFVEPARNGFTCIVDKRSREKRIFIPAKLTDNPYLMNNDPGYINRLMLLPEAERKAKLDGDWWTFTGQVFDEWRENKFPDEPNNALHVIKAFPIPDWWPKVLSIDWGYTAMLWAGWGAISPDAQCFMYREYARTRTKIAVWATDIKHLSKDEHLNSVVMCPSAWQNRGHEKNIAEQFQFHSGMAPKIADNDRLGGKMMLHEFLRWEAKPLLPPRDPGEYDADLAQFILRVKGMEEYRDYLKSFEQEPPETCLPRLKVFDTCSEFINAIPKCTYNDPTTSKGGDPEDVAEFDGDDPYDGGRYLVKEVDYYVRQSKRKGQGLQELQTIIDRLDKTRDMTSYYRAMECREFNKNRIILVAFLGFIKCERCETLEQWVADLKSDNNRLTLLLDKSRADIVDLTKTILDNQKPPINPGPSSTPIQAKHSWPVKKQELESSARREAAEAAKNYWSEKIKRAEEDGTLSVKSER